MKKVFSLLFVLFFVVTSLFSFVVIDDLGRDVEIESTPERVIVAAPSITDYLVKLGLGDKIVGVTDWDAFNAERIGQLTPLNVEKIISLDPDVVFLTGGFQAPEVSRLDEFGITAVVLNPNTFAEIFRTTKLLATIFNVSEKGNEIVNEYQKRVDTISKEKSYKIPLSERKSVFYAMISGSEVKDLYTCVQGSFLNEVISLAGGVNITGNFSGPNGWLPIGVEFIAAENPEAILIPYYYAGGEQPAIDAINNFSPWANIAAVENQALYPIDGNAASYANLELVGLLEQIYEALYGEK